MRRVVPANLTPSKRGIFTSCRGRAVRLCSRAGDAACRFCVICACGQTPTRETAQICGAIQVRSGACMPVFDSRSRLDIDGRILKPGSRTSPRAPSLKLSFLPPLNSTHSAPPHHEIRNCYSRHRRRCVLCGCEPHPQPRCGPSACEFSHTLGSLKASVLMIIVCSYQPTQVLGGSAITRTENGSVSSRHRTGSGKASRCVYSRRQEQQYDSHLLQ